MLAEMGLANGIASLAVGALMLIRRPRPLTRQGRERPGHLGGSEDIDRELAAQVFGRHQLKGALDDDPRIVDDGVQSLAVLKPGNLFRRRGR